MRPPSKQMGKHLMRSLYPFVILVGLQRWQVEGQCPTQTMTSFERISGVTVEDSMLTLLYTAPNMSSLNQHHHLSADLTRQLASLTGAASLNIPITAECNNRCRRSNKCRAFLVDYGRHTCYSIEHSDSQQGGTSGLIRTPKPIHLIQTQDRTSYFEKVCLNLPAVDCERAWIYERVLAHHIHGHDDKVIEDVPSRLRCQEYCLSEREFRCRSGEYDYLTMQCRLSIIDRHIKPASFRPTASNVDYFENQCVPVGNQCDAFDRFEDLDIGRAEIMRSANTSEQCQQFCTQTIKAFVCRSYTWNPLAGKCYLNSVNTFMIGGIERLISAPGLIYYQRNDCIDLKLECDTTAMTLNLRTNEPFRGRMYVRDEPNSCETTGRASLSSSLSIPFQSQARCVTRELPSRYSSVVVVQQHPLIQRKSDRYIKVVCDFQTPNKTITSSYNVVANPWTSTALINATSFAPKIRLRITDKFGVDITGAKLGDELYLRIEAESESIYDMVARSVLAKSGTTEESIVLVDKDGCPTDFRIFPPLKKLNRRTIIGKFDAFKFSSDVVVRFQVDVQFCLNQCPITSCDQNLLLNSNPDQLAEAYNAGSLTTSSPSSGQAPASILQSDPSLIGSASSTEAPAQVPFQQQQQLHHQQQQQQQQRATSDNSQRSQGTSSISNLTSPYQTISNLRGGEQNYYLANLAGQANGRPPSLPANHPLANYSAASNSILESLVNPPEAQVFEQQSRGGPAKGSSAESGGHSKSRDQRQRGQGEQPVGSGSQLADNELQEQEQQQQQEQHQQQLNSRRRRRSAEPAPGSLPRPVPLQREIIVESSASGSQGSRDPNLQQASVHGVRELAAARQRKTLGSRNQAAKQDGLVLNGPAYDLNGKFLVHLSSLRLTDGGRVFFRWSERTKYTILSHDLSTD